MRAIRACYNGVVEKANSDFGSFVGRRTKGRVEALRNVSVTSTKGKLKVLQSRLWSCSVG